MKKTPKVTQCKACGQEIAANVKSCPYCGAKNKKAIYKKWWFWIIVVVIIGAASSGNDNAPKNAENSDAPAADSNTLGEDISAEEIPDIELSTDFEKEVYDIIKRHDGKLLNIDTVNSEKSEEATVTAAILCENDESVVNAILSETSEAVKKSAAKEGVIFSIGDIKDGDEAPVMVVAAVYSDGRIDISSTSSDYNSERNKWIKAQFSAWDGSHIELEKLIIRNLNDEESYKHIETTYRDIANESVRDEVNQVLSDAGYSQRVEVGDLFIQTQFSAKNGFGGTVKNTAFGIASYSNNTVTLIDIG